MLAAAEELTRRGLAHVTLLGEPDKVNAQARRLNFDISKVLCPPRAKVSTMTAVEAAAQRLHARRGDEGTYAELRMRERLQGHCCNVYDLSAVQPSMR